MTANPKDRAALLAKLGIEALNPMQEAALAAQAEAPDLLLLSPTGSGKTLAFLLPLAEALDPAAGPVQALVLAPSRELALQTEQVFRDLGTGLKANAVYGGQAFAKDLEALRTPPALLIGTPGRVADHLRRGTFDPDGIHTLVLDEFDKSLEVGFQRDMAAIVDALPALRRRVLTSATAGVAVPDFLGLRSPRVVDFSGAEGPRLRYRLVSAAGRRPETALDDALLRLLGALRGQRGIVFCSFKETLQRVGELLEAHGAEPERFYGGMEQQERERALIRFRNGSRRVLLATDLAARGLDVPALDFIVHYELPQREEEYAHRNGRTARMKRDGTVYVLRAEGARLPDFAAGGEAFEPAPVDGDEAAPMATLLVSGGRKDKISKGDLAGFFHGPGGLADGRLGLIELKRDCAFVGVPREEAARLVAALDGGKLKGRKLRVRAV
jgi:superfamily II DNA/RNA helicase